MRKITFGGAISLDSLLARPDHSVDWIRQSDEAAALMRDYWATIDTILMGRKTYEVAARAGHADSYPGTQTYVFSRTLKEAPGKRVTLVRDDAVDFVRALKDEPGKGICLMGGGELARPLIEADLVDEIGFNIHPLLLGAGLPVFHAMNREVHLELKECRPFKNGCVYISYAVKHAA